MRRGIEYRSLIKRERSIIHQVILTMKDACDYINFLP